MRDSATRWQQSAAFFQKRAKVVFAYALYLEEKGEDFDGVLSAAAADERHANLCVSLANEIKGVHHASQSCLC